MDRTYQICKRCVMDTTDVDIYFDSEGYCNHCTSAYKRLEESIFIKESFKEKYLSNTISKIKKSNKNQYDCIIGLSGGVDSSYLAYLVVNKYHLRPLAVHIDNGWNSELAVSNIENIVNKLNIDLHTHVINWTEFKELQRAFLKASVVDLEMLSDHAISLVIYKLARKHKIRYFLSGSNIVTESLMPDKWYYKHKLDSLNIKDIIKKYGDNIKLSTYPLFNYVQYIFKNKYVKHYALLNLVEYDKEKAKSIISKELGWKDYGGKHLESDITKFYQNHILPQKYNIDKRRAHLSMLICAGQLSRESALNQLATPLYDQVELANDTEYFIKKLELSPREYGLIMKSPRREHQEFKSYHTKYLKHVKVFQFLKNLFLGSSKNI
jgi:N-acetyl sugar amidotransferase